MNNKKSVWNPPWEVVDNIGGGGQGITRLVRNVETQQVGCLKTLNNNSDSDRRARFSKEALALETLDHHGIPKLLESNAEKYKDDDKLYLVSDYIQGLTLGKKIATGVLSFEQAVCMTKELAAILGYCHTEGEVHRDIKPDNIILKDDDPCTPVLVDFGLSFNNNESAETLTEAEQHIGNRSLILPELLPGSPNRRNPVSDLTQLAGVMLHAITGEHATTLENEEGLPHQRAHIRVKIKANAPPDKLNLLLSFFDRAFMKNTIDRWQTADEIITELDNITAAESEEALSVMQRLEAIAAQVGTIPGLKQTRESAKILDYAKGIVQRQFWDSLKGSGISATSTGGISTDDERHIRFHFHPEGVDHKLHKVQVLVIVKLVAEEIVVTAESATSKKSKIIGRVGNLDQPDYSSLQEPFVAFNVNIIETELMPKLKS